ncbi:MAG: U32 family peptidase [Candidatus Omnitrophica bacterium]|nr:U32 family peptidase [Candidatus Omnitrophota bacterium]
MKKPELLSPAGDWPSLHAALDSGADSVYFGCRDLNMRHTAGNFDVLELKKIMAVLRERGKRGYLTLNTLISEPDLPRVERMLAEAQAAKVDAVILWDMAVLVLAKRLGLTAHLSTQASVANAAAAKAYADLGVSRIILARECALTEIAAIARGLKESGSPCAIEVFIHGAMCVSVSGRCFLSQYTHDCSANEGRCVQPCRREYLIRDVEDGQEFVVGSNYILSPKDLCAMDFVDQVIATGAAALKIEGRMRSPEYVKVVTAGYRAAIDAYAAGTLTAAKKQALREQLSVVYNRGFSTGFYFGRPRDWVTPGLEHSRRKVYLGDVVRYFAKIGVAEIRLRNGDLKIGEELVVIGKTTAAEMFTVTEMQINHQPVAEARRGSPVAVKVPIVLRPGDKVYYWKKI